MNLETLNVEGLFAKAKEPLFLTYLANIQTEKESFVIYYPVLEVKSPKNFFRKHHSIFFFIVTAVVILTMLACVLGCFYYYRRLKETEKRLKYEMSDVRNVANLVAINDTAMGNSDFGVEMGDRSSTSNNEGGYKGLSTQENL